MKVIVSGKGKMGQALKETAKDRREIEILSMVGRGDSLSSLPEANIIVDFSRPERALQMADLAHERGIPFITGTTGFSPRELEALKIIGEDIPVLFSANFSLGIALMEKTLAMLRESLLGKWDIEMVEIHHGQKVDAPSGTAYRLLEALDPEGEFTRLFGRQGVTGGRERKEIGVHVLRGGTVSGEHQVHFLGNCETLCVTHRAENSKVFANGAWLAAEKMQGKEAGFYSLSQLLFSF